MTDTTKKLVGTPQTIESKIKAVNKILREGEPHNISTDYNGFTGYTPQFIIDAMNAVFNIGGWGFDEMSNDIVIQQTEKGQFQLAISQVKVWLRDIDGEKLDTFPTAWGQGRVTQGNIGDARKSGQTDALKKAKELGTFVTTVIVDDHGSMLALSRMDGAIHISPKFAHAKAYTSANLGAPTEGLAQYAGEGKPYFDFTALFGGKMTVIAGGFPVVMHGKVIGAVGVGGSTDVSQDAQCALEAKKNLEA